MGKRAHCIGYVEVMQFVGIGLKNNLAEAFHGNLVVIVKCIQVPHVSRDDVGREGGLLQNSCQGHLNIVVVNRASPFELAEPIQDVR